jgi:hypothetical protein
MRSTAIVRTREAEGIALRMRKHFGHKVEVELRDGVSRVRLPSGEFELAPGPASLVVRARADDGTGLRRVQDVVASHLGRFARAGALEIDWTQDGLEGQAAEWVSTHRNARHALRTRDWVRELRPGADDALVLAALLHDVDRHAGGLALAEQVAGWDDEEALRAHAERSAAIAADWLRAQGAPADLAESVAALVRLHERGGSEDADVLQAADSLSFLETNPAARWVRQGLADRPAAERKLRWMCERIRLPGAGEQAAALLERALAALAERQGS